METTAPRHEVKKCYPRGKNVWISRHDACALYKALLSANVSKSIRTRLRKELYHEIIRPLYHYRVPCAMCHGMLDIVKDKEMSIEELTKQVGVEGKHIICHRCYCEDDEK